MQEQQSRAAPRHPPPFHEDSLPHEKSRYSSILPLSPPPKLSRTPSLTTHTHTQWADPDESKRAQVAKTGPPGLHRSAGAVFGGNSSNSINNNNNNRNDSNIWGGESEITKKEILDLWDAGARARRERESRGAGFYHDDDDGDGDDFEADDGVLILGPNDGGFAGVGGQEEEEEEEEDDVGFGGLDSEYGPGFWRWN
ncbi:hypothetical protein JOL62DRAFT_566874 [Phyllosticta paracitricarpa]|uniref:Uncharacterized protein n=1 Tax=Phyllosticta paracitricarpa TaxID=2016321 RepID=A0ABR1NEJ6_9PEZI